MTTGKRYATTAATLGLLLAAANTARAICDVIPQPEVQFRGETGSLNRVFASPGDPLRISIDTATGGCEASSAGFTAGTQTTVVSDFNDFTLQGWTQSGGVGSFGVADVGLGPSIVGQFACCSQGKGASAPASYLGDWAAMGVTELTWIWGSFEDAFVTGSTDVLRIGGPGGSAEYRPNLGFLQQSIAVQISAPIDTATPPSGWVVTSGTWQGLIGQVDEVVVVGTLDNFTDIFVLDDITLTTSTTGSVTTLLYEPPGGPANAVVIPSSTSCGMLSGQIATCSAALGGGTVTCRDDLSPSVAADSLRFSMPDQGYAGPVTVAVSTEGAALPCQLATTACGGPGAPTGLLACIDQLYAGDGTCEAEAQNAHPQFPGLTALPTPNDFSGICDSANPSIPCQNSNADVQFTTDSAGNLVVPIDWRGVLVPGTLPIPRLVQANSSAAAFTGPPPEPAQTPGAPVEVPGFAYLQSFSPKGLRVDPLFNPLANPDSSAATELFGSADAEFGVIRVLRRSPAFRQCEAGDRAALPCTTDLECPNSQCVPAQCRGGTNAGNACIGDGQCPGGECGAALFDFSDRYSGGGTGPILLTSAQYDAEALNPVAIDGLAATDDIFMFVRSEPLEQEDLNLDGDQSDETIVTLRDASTNTGYDLGAAPGALGRASTRVREFPFRFPAVAVEDDVVALMESEPDEGGDANLDGDDWDAILRIFRLEPTGPVDLLGGTALASDAMARINRNSLELSDGLVFFRQSEPDGAARATTYMQASPDDDVLWEIDVTADGRFVAFNHLAGNLVPGDTNGQGDVFVLDRDADADGVLDEAGQTTIVRVSVTSNGSQGFCAAHPACAFSPSWAARAPKISADGRYVAFVAYMEDLVAGDTNDLGDTFVHDRDADGDGIFDEAGAISTIRASVSTAGAQQALESVATAISADGRFVAMDMGFQPWIRDRDTDEDGIFDEPGAVATFQPTDAAIGVAPNGFTELPAMTPDGRYVVYESTADNLIAGDTNGRKDVYVIDRDADLDGVFDETSQVTITRVSVTSDQQEVAGGGVRAQISDDGRLVAFHTSYDWEFGPSTQDPGSKTFVHDRDADEDGIFDEPGAVETRRVVRSAASRQIQLQNYSNSFALSPDGRTMLLEAGQTASWTRDRIDLETGIAAQISFGTRPSVNYELPAMNGSTVMFHDEPTDSIRMDGIDTSAPVNDLSGDGDQFDRVLAVADTRTSVPVGVTVLGPAERASVAAGNAAFLRPESADGAGADLNGDLDAEDRVVQVYRNRQGASNLGLAAEDVAISDQVVAALASEAGEGALLNGDGDQDDLVVHWNDLATGTSGTWQNLFVAGDAVQAVGPYVAFTVPEADQGSSQNGDGDTGDRVLRVYDTSTSSYVSFQDELGTPIPGLAVDDFVLGEQVIAFRVNEFDQGQNLNDVAPPIPGGVADGDLLDSVIHVADLATGTVYNGMNAAIPCPVEACDPRVPYRLAGAKVTFLTLEAEQGGNDLDQSGDGGTGLVLQHFNPDALAAGGTMADACDVVSGALAGICTGTGDACAGDLDCLGNGTCYFPPGGCLFDFQTACNPDASTCPSGQFCVPGPSNPSQGTCHEFQGPCLTDAECTAPAFCSDDGLNSEQLFASLAEEPDGRQRYVSLGRCTDGDGSCRNDGDCNEGATCDGAVTVIATAADPDADGLADPIDNCPDVANGDQLDVDQDGIGDACDRQSCGNGLQEYTETCDHGIDNGIDGVCDAGCAYVGGGTACSDGIDNDGDGKVDGGDPGCANGADTSERDAAKVCDDGKDNDGDYRGDVNGDPGCGTSPNSLWEDPACNDGIDNDGDGKVDYDGFGGFYEPDPNCGKANKNKETAGSCGLGFELMLLLPLLARLRTLRRRSGHVS